MSSNKFTGTSGKTATAEDSKPKKSFDKLLTVLNEKRISLLEFGVAEEKRRKRILKDDYQEIKNEAGWLYEQPIEYPADVLAKEKELNKPVK